MKLKDSSLKSKVFFENLKQGTDSNFRVMLPQSLLKETLNVIVGSENQNELFTHFCSNLQLNN